MNSVESCNGENRQGKQMNFTRRPPEGSWWTKVPLGCAISESIHSCSRDRNKHLAASYCE